MILSSFVFLVLSLFSLLSGASQSPNLGYIGACEVKAKFSRKVNDFGSNCRNRLIESSKAVLHAYDVLPRLNSSSYPTGHAFNKVPKRFKLSNGVSGRLEEYYCELSHNGIVMTCYLKILFAKIVPEDRRLFFQMNLEVIFLNECVPHIIRNGECVPPYCTDYRFKPSTAVVSLELDPLY